jgi:hypothetical protein
MESLMRVRAIFVLISFFLLFSIEAFACGDSLYRVGKGVSYRVYTAPLPGSVLVYGQTEGARQLAEALAQSGHEVHLVETELDLALEMKKGGYDVVIAPYGEHASVEASQRDSAAEYIPVALSQDEETAARQSYSRVLVADRAEIKHYLKAIHKSLTNKA